MNVYKIEFNNPNIKHPDRVKLCEWKVKENGKLSKGQVIFTYEYERQDGQLKIEKFKSSLNEITVKKMCSMKPGDLIQNGMEIFDYEKCSHPVCRNDLCAVCGEDLRKSDDSRGSRQGYNAGLKNNGNTLHKIASIPIIHSEPKIKVSEQEANDIGKRDLANLVKNRKLVLLVDLDHTLIHTTNDNVSDQLKEVYHYELVQKNVWYHTKFRPGCKKFLEEMSKYYELHMVTFGERNYAHTIANFMDPDRRYFHDRILSRNEIINPILKTDNLKALFPRGDLMVCIIDDREDVWNYARNLICVQPYVYFKNTGDINDPHANASQGSAKNSTSSNFRKRKHNSAQQATTTLATAQNEAVESLSTALEPVKANEDSESNSSTSSSTKSTGKDDTSAEKHDLTNKLNDDDDPDDYLVYLQDILKRIHDEYYSIYEQRLKRKQEKTSLVSNENEINEADLPDVKKVLPLIKSRILEDVVITFSGVVPVGTSPIYDLKKQRCYLMAKSLGAKVNENLVLDDEDQLRKIDKVKSKGKAKKQYTYRDEDEFSSNSSGGDDDFRSDDDIDQYEMDSNQQQGAIKKSSLPTTHLVAAKFGTSKVHDALKSKRQIKVVTPEWLIMCNFKWIHCDEEQFKLTKEYDYRTCTFHHDYNLHQKYASVAKQQSQLNFESKIGKSSGLIKNESTESLSFFEAKTKKLKSNQEEYIKSESKISDQQFAEDIFELMDKEVDKELEDDDEEDDEEERIRQEEDLDDDDEDDYESEDDEEDEQEVEKKVTSSKTNKKVSFKVEDSNDFKLSDEDEDGEVNGDKKVKTISHQSTSSSSSSFNTSSNSSSDDGSSSIDSIDDEFGQELERDLANKNK